MKPKVETHLSRSETLELVFGKLSVVTDEADRWREHGAHEITLSDLPKIGASLKRIALEARRAASLIETYQSVSKAGHCFHCGKPYEQHTDQPPPIPEGAPRVRAKGDQDAPDCRWLKRHFESVEIETYLPLKLDGGGQ